MAKFSRSFVILALLGVAGLLLLIAADRFDRPELIGPGLLLFAVGTISAGVYRIARRYSWEQRHEASVHVFEGTAAILIGIAIVTLGLLFGAAGLAFLFQAQHRFYAHLLDRPGAAIVALGVMSSAAGAASIIGAREWRGSARRFLANLPQRIAGVLVLLFGLAVLGAGVLEFVAPETVDQAIDTLRSPFRTPTRDP